MSLRRDAGKVLCIAFSFLGATHGHFGSGGHAVMLWNRIDAYQIATTPDFIHFHLDEIGGNYFIQMPGARSDEINRVK